MGRGPHRDAPFLGRQNKFFRGEKPLFFFNFLMSGKGANMDNFADKLGGHIIKVGPLRLFSFTPLY